MHPVDPTPIKTESSAPPDAGSHVIFAERREWPVVWLLAATLAVCAMAAWQKTPGWLMFSLATVATMGAGWSLKRVDHPRAWATVAVGALSVSVAMAAFETYQVERIQRDGPTFLEQQRVARATRIAARIKELQPLLTNAALKATTDADKAPDIRHPALAIPATGRTETAVVLFRDGQLVSHAGQSRVPLDTGAEGLSLVHTPFYTAMIARSKSESGRFQAVSVALLASAPPADRFTQSLIQELDDEMLGDTVLILPPAAPGAVVDSSERVVTWGSSVFARVVVTPRLLGQALVKERERARVTTSIPLALAALGMLVTGWRRPARTRERLAMVVAMTIVVALLPLGSLSNRSGVFDAANYYTPMGGALTANIAALIFTASLSLVGLFLVLRSPKLWYSRRVALLIVLVLAGAGPFVLRDLARGIAMTPGGASAKLWMAWQLGIALAGASVLVAGASAGQVAIGTRRGLPSWLAPLVAATAAILALPFWNASATWPAWYPALWILAIALLAFVRRGPALIAGAAIVAGCGAVTLTWGATIRERMALATTDASNLSQVDAESVRPLAQLADMFRLDSVPLRDADAFVRRFADSDLAKIGYSARMALWTADSSTRPEVDVRLASVRDTIQFQRIVSRMARVSGRIEMRAVPIGALTVLVAGVPLADSSVITIAVPPLGYLASTDPFETLTGLAIRSRGEPPYTLSVTGSEPYSAARDTASSRRVTWIRNGSVMHGDTYTGEEVRLPVHVEVDMRGPAALVPRGALLVFFDVAVVILLWAVSAMSDGALWRWLRRRARQLSRSYRIRLSLALLAFFAVPAAAFALWAAIRLREDDHSARELIVREALRISALEPSEAALAEISGDVDASLYLYRNGQLSAVSNPMLDLLAPIGRLLPRNIPMDTLNAADTDDFSAISIPTGRVSSLVGYRRVRLVRSDFTADSSLSNSAIVATPARGNEYALDERRTDLAVQVLFALSLGALAALWLSGVAARTLARPVGTLREAALALAAGQRTPALSGAPVEFAPVFSAFGQMATDLSQSRDELEAAQRRTEAVLQHVASGVLAVNAEGQVIIANPQAERMLGVVLRPGTPMSQFANTGHLTSVISRVSSFLESYSDEASFDTTVKSRQFNARLTRLPAGAVLTLDDVTELASAQRVLAWGEMARQIAHEIKNPLTPIRLGVQHLRRAYRDKRGDFSDILERNVGRVLEEIDHLDEIARAFSRYGTVPAEREAPLPVAIAGTIQAVLALESLGESGVNWTFANNLGGESDVAWARSAELKEVLLNLLENARLARAASVEIQLDHHGESLRICVVDDGDGIAPDVLPRIFEPHFSTRTSGSGLGLAISRRMIEGWGGTVTVTSEVNSGTTVQILLGRVNESMANRSSPVPGVQNVTATDGAERSAAHETGDGQVSRNSDTQNRAPSGGARN